MNAPRPTDERRYKMRELCAASGLPRQAIHFYLKEGLLPPGVKTGRNTAYYTDEHLARLETIRRLQHERFLPLKVIKAVLEGDEASYSDDQRTFLAGVRGSLDVSLRDRAMRGTVDADALARALDIATDELDRAIAIGLVVVVEQPDGRRMMDAGATWLLETFASIRRLGFTRELGFTIDELGFYETHVQKLVEDEVRLLFRKVRHLPPEQVARLIESALPHIGQLLARYHGEKVRELFASLV